MCSQAPESGGLSHRLKEARAMLRTAGLSHLRIFALIDESYRAYFGNGRED